LLNVKVSGSCYSSYPISCNYFPQIQNARRILKKMLRFFASLTLNFNCYMYKHMQCCRYLLLLTNTKQLYMLTHYELYCLCKYCKKSRTKGTSYVHQKRREANGIGHILRKNCLLKHANEGKDRRARKTRKNT